MRAIIVDHDQPMRLRLGEAPDPGLSPGQLLMEVRHSTLNPADLYIAETSESGANPGFDAASVVIAISDEGGPPVGSRVDSFGARGGWAQRRAVDVRDTAIVPDTIDLAAAATLPVEAGTALRALWQAGPITGRRVLVTGASGGVGSFAVQLAAVGGAHVVASAGSADGAKAIEELGRPTEVVLNLNSVSQSVDVVIDTVGGPQLVAAYQLLAPGGCLQSVGWASGTDAVFRPGATLGSKTPKTIMSVFNGPGLADRREQLEALLRLVGEDRLRPAIGWRGSWESIAEAARALARRQIRGKAVLDIIG